MTPSAHDPVQTIRLFKVTGLNIKVLLDYILAHADFPVKPLKDKPLTKIKEVQVDRSHHSHHDKALELLFFRKEDHKKIFRLYFAFSDEGATISIEKRLKSLQNESDFIYALEKVSYLIAANAPTGVLISVSSALPVEKQKEIYHALGEARNIFSDKNIKLKME